MEFIALNNGKKYETIDEWAADQRVDDLYAAYTTTEDDTIFTTVENELIKRSAI